MRPEQAVGPRIKRISNAMDRKRTVDLEDLGLTSSQGLVLGYLARHTEEAVFPGDVCRHFGLSQPTVTGILQRLEAKGFLRYADDPGDRRRRRIVPTQKALDCHEWVKQRFIETEQLLTEGLTEAERSQLLVLLDRLLANMDAGCDSCAPCPKEETT
jgi:DNA-binding MarR family transcriptional regulator